MKPAAGALVKIAAHTRAYEFDAIPSTLIEPRKNRTKGLIRVIEKHTIVHEAIDADGVDVIGCGQFQLRNSGSEMLDDDQYRENSRAMFVRSEIPPGFDRTRCVEMGI
jgi:hypothetical protein